MVGVDYSAWMVQDGELRRRFIYTDSKTRKYIATIYLDCKIEQGAGEPLTFLSFMFTPFRVVDGLDLGLSLAPLDGGRPAPVGVNVTSVDDGQGALMSPRTPQGLRLLLSHLLNGRQLKFGIFQGPEQFVDMPFYNDPEFAELHRSQVAALTTRKGSMFLAKITGVIPKGMNLPAAPIETREFDNITAAKQWLLGEALSNLPTPVNNVEVFENGQSVWREWHWSHDALFVLKGPTFSSVSDRQEGRNHQPPGLSQLVVLRTDPAPSATNQPEAIPSSRFGTFRLRSTLHHSCGP
ncbi:hypothetical protein ACNJX9_09865 [Bradyrhizobium sp. DASA03076]|uniref:hypothetical protein n=1 Tax=Bradyrhizobium sp. BLXBL-03 TaxID=3395916 RepID=UPI003F716D79